jgi:hypothetical protein
MAPPRKARRSWTQLQGAVLSRIFGVIVLFVGAWFLFEGFDGMAFFAGTGGTYTQEITSAHDATAHPYSADQWLYLPLGLLPFGFSAAGLIGRRLRSSLMPSLIFCALEAALCLVILVLEIAWAMSAAPFSNYLPSTYGSGYGATIAMAAFAFLVSSLLAALCARWIRKGLRSRRRAHRLG